MSSCPWDFGTTWAKARVNPSRWISCGLSCVASGPARLAVIVLPADPGKEAENLSVVAGRLVAGAP